MLLDDQFREKRKTVHFISVKIQYFTSSRDRAQFITSICINNQMLQLSPALLSLCLIFPCALLQTDLSSSLVRPLETVVSCRWKTLLLFLDLDQSNVALLMRLSVHLLEQPTSEVKLFLRKLSGKFVSSYNNADFTPLSLNFPTMD